MKLRGFFAVLAVLLLVLCYSVPAFAAVPGYVTNPGSDDYTVSIVDTYTPLARAPGLSTILDEDVPLAGLPNTGAYMMIGRTAVFGVSSIGLGLLVGLSGLKKLSRKK